MKTNNNNTCIEWLLLSIIIAIYTNNAAQLTFTSSTNIADEYCISELNWSSNQIQLNIASYCDDIDNILIHYCGNYTLFEILDPSYQNTMDSTENSCVFVLKLDEQTIDKTYILSNNIPINKIEFISVNETNIILSKSFLDITSYEGFIAITDINFTSNDDTFSLININSNEDTELYIAITGCNFINLNGMNGTIINIPKSSNSLSITKAIDIKFEDCKMENIISEYGSIYIERNNVFISFVNFDITNITSSSDGSGGIIHWICQQKNNGVDLCGDLLITNSYFYGIDTNIFTIDLSLDPSQIQFILEMDTSVFTNVNGIIFNFNHNNNILQPTHMRIQQQNTFINIKNSHFENNGLQKDELTLNGRTYSFSDAYKQNGTIFTINSITVPNIIIQNSKFTHNAALYGTIFYWYCSRHMVWLKDNYCGSIVLHNNIFDNNMIDENTNNIGVRYGSLLYSEIHEDMEFNILIQDCDFMQHIGNLIYFKASSMSILTPSAIGNSSFGNWSLSNATDNISFQGSVIYVEASTFKDNQDLQEGDSSPNLGTIFTISELETVYTFITGSIFDNNEANYGSPIFSADYAPIIHIIHSNFTNNNARMLGLFHLRMNGISMIEISDSTFISNGNYSTGGYASPVSIISTNDNIYLLLNIIKSFFIENISGKYGCFNLYSGDINIIDSTFDSNEGDGYSVVILNVRQFINLNINHTVFKNNRENSAAFTTTGIPKGLFNINKGNVMVSDGTFEGNALFNDGIYTTTDFTTIKLSNNQYIDNFIPNIIHGTKNIVEIEECLFMRNFLRSSMIQGKDIKVIHSTFVDNSGFKIYPSLFGYDENHFTLNVKHCNFTVNGIGMEIDIISATGLNAQIDIGNCVFDSNTVKNVGVIFTKSSNSMISIINSNINGIIATGTNVGICNK